MGGLRRAEAFLEQGPAFGVDLVLAQELSYPAKTEQVGLLIVVCLGQPLVLGRFSLPILMHLPITQQLPWARAR